MKRRLLAVAPLTGAVLTATPALAYTTFLLPQDFWPSTDSVAVQGASTQTFFQPGVAIPGDVQITNPNGAAGATNSVEVAPTTTNTQVALSAPGTYRVSTGEVISQPANIWDLGNDQRGDPRIQARRTGDATPQGGQAATFQSVQLADTYLTYGAPSRTVVDQNHGHLAIHPITDPNQIIQINGFQIEVLFNGAPLANFSVVVYGEGDADTNLAHYVNTDAMGRATLPFDHPGHFTATVRKLARPALGGDATIQLFTTTLTFDVMAQAHANVTVPPPQAQQLQRQQPAHRRPGTRRDRTMPL